MPLSAKLQKWIAVRDRLIQCQNSSNPPDAWRAWLHKLFPSAFVDEAGQPVPFADFHTAFWDYVWSIESGVASPAFFAVWPRGGGKCLAAETEILCADGTRIAIADVQIGREILSFNEAVGKFEHDTITQKWHSGIKPCIQLETRTRKRIVLTKEHKVLTFDGWKQAGELTIGDRIASPRKAASLPSEQRSDEEVRFLAYMLAEGNTSGPGNKHNCNFTNGDQVVIDDFIHCAKILGFPIKYRLNFRYDVLSPGRQWARDQKIAGTLAINKKMPEWVFSLSIEQKWQFLAAFIDTDGWVAARKLGITLANPVLVDDLMYLFMQVGVVCSVYEKKNNHAGAWTVAVDNEYLPYCAENLPLKLKGNKLRAVCEIPRYSLADNYPTKVCRDLPFRLNRALRNAGIARVGNGTYEVTRAKLRKAIAHTPLEQWVKLEESEVFWDKIEEITDVGERDTYDVEVRRNHNLITGGLVTHNSTNTELACAALAARNRRQYGIYLCSSQAQADDHVANVSSLLETPAFAQHYPQVASRKLNQYGTSLGWRRNRLRTASGFTLDALGLDVAGRGRKLQHERPDLLVIDDIDDQADSPLIVARKIRALTRKILPAAGPDAIILGAQNLIHPDSIFSQLLDGRARFLTRRIVSGPYPALKEMRYVETDNPTQPVKLTGGEPTWAGFTLARCQQLIDDEGLDAFLVERQHEVLSSEGLFFHGTWRDSVHVVPAFPIPQGWRIDRSFDWGSAHPFAVVWIAESDGTPVPGRRTYPRGTLFVINEYYGCDPRRPNVGINLDSATIARNIRRAEDQAEYRGRILQGPSDAIIYDVRDGASIAQTMTAHGVTWERFSGGPGSRVNGATLLKDRLRASLRGEGPGLYVFDRCPQVIRTLPKLPRDVLNPEDIETSAEDHLYDAIRNRVLYGARGPAKPRGVHGL